jgi:predicted RNase H-like nuclease (RuvC/YqgF family)
MPFAIGRIIFRSPLTARHPGDDVEIRQNDNKIIATLRNTVEGQRRTIVQLENKLTDLSTQNEELRKSRVVSPQEEAAFKNQSKIVIDYQNQLNQLALWLRANKSMEISQGRHAGKELIPLILQYLGGVMPDATVPLTPTPTPEGGKVQ